jgi:RNA polymerase sigma-70 factor (ECF subfamily)
MNHPSLIGRLRAGERAAFNEIAERHGCALRATARRVVKCPETAAEVVQEVLFRLWRDREALAIREHLGAYLSRAVRNRALDHLKRQRVESRWRERMLLEATREHASRLTEASSEEALDAPWDGAVQRALERLPSKRRQAILLRWRDGLSYQEIAAALGVSAKTVENQIGRGLKSLRAALTARAGGAP